MVSANANQETRLRGKKNVVAGIFALLGFMILFPPAGRLALSQEQPSWVHKVGGQGLGNPFCVNPWDDSTIYASTGNSFLYVSRDRGYSWSTLSYLTGGTQIKSVAVSANDTNTILVAMEAGPPDRIVKTTDHGVTWVQTMAREFYYYGVPLAYNPVPGNDTVYTMANNVIWRSTDFGSTWDTASVPPFGTGDQGWEFALVRPDSTNIIIVADYGSGIWKSVDYGKTWRNTHYASVEVPALAMTPSNPRIMYGARWGGGGGFVKSTDGGETWTYSAPLNGLNMWGVSVARTNPDYVITGTYGPSLGTNGGIYISRDAGTTWERTYQGLVSPLNYACLVLDTMNVNVLQADGLWRLSYERRTVAIISPNGGEMLIGGTVDTIEWTSTNITNVRLEYTTNNGSTWVLIAPAVPASQGLYAWRLPELAATQCRVRAFDVTNTTIADQSDTTFSILSTLTTTYPNGGETCPAGSRKHIVWSSVGVTSVGVYYTTNNGLNWFGIGSGIPSSQDSLPWTIPYSPSALCRVRVSSMSNPALADVSDTTFTILETTSFLSELILIDNGSKTDTLRFGEMAGATDSLDPLLGEIELAAKPGIDTFDVRWDLTDGRSSKLDCRDTVGMVNPRRMFTAEMQAGPGGYPFTLHWKPGTLPSGYLVLRDAATEGATLSLNMSVDSMCVITDTSIKAVQIIHFCMETMPIAVTNRWNIISLPVRGGEGSKAALFPTAVSEAFTFQDRSYAQSGTLVDDMGYWLKFAGGQIVPLTGRPVLCDSFNVFAGWNMIGAISQPVPSHTVSGIETEIRSSFYSYNDGYRTATTLEPGKGYWIKVSSDGQLVFSSMGSLPKRSTSFQAKTDPGNFTTLTVEDAARNSQTLYLGPMPGEHFSSDLFELPPCPPEGIFDARFSTQRMTETYLPHSLEPQDYQILFHSASFPVTIAWDLAGTIDESITLTPNAGGAPTESIPLKGKGKTKISDQRITSVLLKVQGRDQVPTEFAMRQNYPNPFNPRTVIRYELPVDSKVSLRIYNMLGQVVKTLVEEIEGAGYKTSEWNSTNAEGISVASGVYFCRLEAASIADPGRAFLQVEKMLLLK